MRIIYSEAALRDVRAMVSALQAGGDSVVRGFLSSLRDAERFLSEHPDGGRATKQTATRLVLIRRFHCHTFYRRLPGDRLRIIRVRDARRQPLTWR